MEGYTFPMDDHFEHGSLIPPPEPSPHQRRPVIIAVSAVVVIVLGILVALYWRQLIAFPSSFSSDTSSTPGEQQAPTIEQKMQLLAGATGTPSAAPVSPERKAALLEETDSGAVNALAPSISAEEKAKLLGGQ